MAEPSTYDPLEPGANTNFEKPVLSLHEKSEERVPISEFWTDIIQKSVALKKKPVAG